MNLIQFQKSLLQLEDKLYYFALSLTADPERAQDLLQETYLKALTYREKFKDNTNFKAWIYTIMKNTFINDYRRSIKTKTTFDFSNNDYLLNVSKDIHFPSPESSQSEKEILNNIYRLDKEFREPFLMFLNGFKYKEIASKLGLPLGTVKSRIFFTRKKLEKWLKEYAK
ncbi:RNA polymerase sigma factor [Halosquirtibacter xylanolyticus]|uniref:RNA polymerase sigma factor n=1 Tax=Halosquirtibacter xylanolyticus TaxID=3374599 RepID=UPI00374A4821|nr:RNA polymerase sigma factor [Prolixibacteraceae bacterium]